MKLSCLQTIVGGNHLHILGCIAEVAIMTDLVGDADGIGLDRVGEKISLLCSGCCHSRLDQVHDAVDVGRDRSSCNGALHGASVLVAHDDDQTDSERLDGIFDTSQADIIDDIARRPNDKDPVQVFAEDMLWSCSSVGAGDNHGDRGV